METHPASEVNESSFYNETTGKHPWREKAMDSFKTENDEGSGVRVAASKRKASGRKHGGRSFTSRFESFETVEFFAFSCDASEGGLFKNTRGLVCFGLQKYSFSSEGLEYIAR